MAVAKQIVHQETAALNLRQEELLLEKLHEMVNSRLLFIVRHYMNSFCGDNIMMPNTKALALTPFLSPAALS